MGQVPRQYLLQRQLHTFRQFILPLPYKNKIQQRKKRKNQDIEWASKNFIN